MQYLPVKIIKSVKRTKNKVVQGGLYETDKLLLCDLLNTTAPGLNIKPSDMPVDIQDYLNIIMGIEPFSNKDYPKLSIGFSAIHNHIKTHENNLSPVTETRDYMGQALLLEEWAKTKEVLRPDPTFTYHLIQTEKLVLAENILQHIPYQHFFVDLMPCKKSKFTHNIFDQIDGIFVHVLNVAPKIYTIAMYMCVDVPGPDVLTFSLYRTYQFDKEPEIKIDTAEISESVKAKYSKMYDDKRKLTQIPERTVMTFIIQLLCYCSMTEPDIQENSSAIQAREFTKRKTKNKSNIKVDTDNKVHIQDIGIRVGKAIRKNMYEATHTDSDDGTTKGTHKSPVAHYRRAHWHRYWIGHGRKQSILKWIEPVFVKGIMSDVITIHDVY